MNYENDVERERVIVQALTARTLPEINMAALELRQWLKEHPDDLNAEDALEPLAMLRQGMQAEIEVNHYLDCSAGPSEATSKSPSGTGVS